MDASIKELPTRDRLAQWWVAKTIASRRVDAIAIEDLNVAGMLKRCQVKKDDTNGRFLPNGQPLEEGIKPCYFGCRLE
ncbi:hypothetical protein [Microseira wollei]|uniref:hypothetical protein n=1 Tax=Microseira wollei TaxID=467598 RepID=UPI001CFF39BF|nr:hypothetical protein [Microseira wollei]